MPAFLARCLLLTTFAEGTVWAAGLAAPDFDRVDHSDSDAALVLPRTLGSRRRIERIARELEVGSVTFEQRLESIGTWMSARLPSSVKGKIRARIVIDCVLVAWMFARMSIRCRTLGVICALICIVCATWTVMRARI